MPPALLAAATLDLGLDSPSENPDWADVPAVVTWFEQLPSVPGSHPPLILFVERVAHDPTVSVSRELHEWIETRSGLDPATQREIHVTTLRHSVRLRALSNESYTDGKVGQNGHPSTPHGGDPGALSSSVLAHTPSATAEITETGSGREPVRIWGGVPLRNPDFTGRETLLSNLRKALETRSAASVLPQTLHGMGGVGKTQLAVEFVYRYSDQYDVVWWIAAEQQSLVLQSLLDLSRRLGLPRTEDMRQTATMVMDALATTPLRWLLVYDNALNPDDITGLVPSAGGHVILTSRNQTWASVWDAIEVDVFDRPESVELIRKRGNVIAREDAEALAEKLGDLPLALDQAASWQKATGMPVGEYLELFDHHVRELLDEGRPASYPTTVAAFVNIAFERLRVDAPAVAQLLELFAFLGAEPLSVSLLRSAKNSNVSQPLAGVLRDTIKLNRTIRALRQYGLARVGGDQSIQVHRLVQLVLRDGLSEDLAEQSRRNAQAILSAANPEEPDESRSWPIYALIEPHLQPAGLIYSDRRDAHQVVIDQIRYLGVIGDSEGARRLGELTVNVWQKNRTAPNLGPDGEHTLLATRHLAVALSDLGLSGRAKALKLEAFRRFQENAAFGRLHEHTLSTLLSIGTDLRAAGDFKEALASENDAVERHEAAFGEDDTLTISALGNRAVSLRMLSRFQEAYDVDIKRISTLQDTVGENNWRTLLAQSNLARDLYGLGRYTEALELQRGVLPLHSSTLGDRHPHVLLAIRTLTIALRKTGSYREALPYARTNFRDLTARFGPDHEHVLSAAMTLANTLRVMGQPGEARNIAMSTLTKYRRVFGDEHPLTLAASTNTAIILRALGEHRDAFDLDERTLRSLTNALGAEHGYTLCAASNHSNNLAQAHDLQAARDLSRKTLELSRSVRGVEHPYTLACAVNSALDLVASGDSVQGRELLDETVLAMSRTLGPDHPETVDVGRGKRAECDIEPPPT
ncbi:FxSxx-COOH system tetratricopeptide repeat protein [Catenuloplanes niger]|uniref:Tetratricopeptide (TPR) repeat protein n=1 Tax=Catenuloplanes niger TaxID=587534 RepID=A0AAE4CUS6_9ACTN|nr:tetratricopeptide (TPR) repeat protein [Catenuloplanes niger]